jgi:hypothetical protein
MQELGRPDAGQHVSVKAVGRAIHLVSFALKRAAEAGVPFERLVELPGWESDLVREGLERVAPEPSFFARLAPAGADARAVAQAAAMFDATTRLRGLTPRVLADVEDEAWSPAPAELGRPLRPLGARGARGAKRWDDRAPGRSAEPPA